ncbi:LPS assembly lipoprotein LptE [Marinobacter sp. F3R08]|uniref:LPS-assembly lipoprotein LptE n=1 Tax=Marinobacter sp. F3R08 TaxID=2841559 RepID=UPI001C07F0CD|nr:LPS assembly lipoprotein LptE [Marinobacter sp. F3R08]MBU2954547.1 hypothetical protein [Marinobacter sp. F3R08]
MLWNSALKSAPYRLSVAVIAALVAGCGFQLRGAPPVSSALQPLAVECSSHIPDTLCQSIREQLTLGDVSLVPVENADFILRLSNFKQDRRASAIAADASAAEYTLRHSVDLEVISADRIPMVADTRLTTTESYQYDETNVLAKQREEDALVQQLNDRLAQQIIFRLAPLTPQKIEAIRSDYRQNQKATGSASGNHEN